MPARALVFALALVLVGSASGAVDSSLVYRRKDHSVIAFPGAIRAFCDSNALRVLTLGPATRSHWQLGVARGNLRTGRIVAFTWEQPRGIELFALDGKTQNEASEGAEGSRGRIVLRRAGCARGAALEIDVTAFLASEFADGTPIRVSGTFQGRVGARPGG